MDGEFIRGKFFAVFVFDSGEHQGGQPEGFRGNWRQISSGFYPEINDVLKDAAVNAVKNYGTAAKIFEVNFASGSVEHIASFIVKKKGEESDGDSNS